VADVADEGGGQTVSLIRNTGGQGIFLHADVAQALEVQALIEKVVATYGRLDCAHNNAGIAKEPARTADCSDPDWDRIIGTNLKGTWLCMKYEITQMLTQRGGVIVNTASTVGLRGARFAGVYAAASHGVLGLTRSAALEYIGDGIRINAVCPGIVDTPMIRSRLAGDPAREAQFQAASPIGRMAAPEEIAQAVVWLCSDAASYITGHALLVDGGRTAE